MLILFRNSKFTKTTKHTKKLLIIASSKQNMSSNLYNSSSNNITITLLNIYINCIQNKTTHYNFPGCKFW